MDEYNKMCDIERSLESLNDKMDEIIKLIRLVNYISE